MDEQKDIHPDDLIHIQFVELLQSLQNTKPSERGELARRYQITITELEKVLAYFEKFVARRDMWPWDSEKEVV